MSKATAASLAGLVRLHLSPFTPALFQSVLPKPLQILAKSVSYHTTQSDPDKGFGFLELPTGEADKLRNKLHGATLRGHRMSVEKARPEKRKAPTGETEVAIEEPTKKKSKTKKSKSKDEIAGVELPADRKIKRGWTDATIKRGDEKKRTGVVREKSRYTDKDELLFRTGDLKKKKGTKIADKSDKPESAEKKEKKDKSKTKSDKNDKHIIHEFETTSKFPTFLKQDKTKRVGAPPTYVDGKGWVDEEGKVVEEVKTSRRAAAPAPVVASAPPAAKKAQTKPVPEAKAPAVDSSDSGSDVSSDSSSEASSEDDSDDDSDEDADSDVEASSIAPASTSAPPPAAGEAPAESATEVHPLEALYKRRPTDPPRLALDTTFSFFTADAADEEEDEPKPTVPPTPFTATDLKMRSLRSAAPTPDTAHPGKRTFADEDDEDEEDYFAGAATADADGKPARSAMVDEFYARRSELNASWRTRRREASKAARAKRR